MNVKEIMTANPTCCKPDWTLRKAAQAMKDTNCGEIPVVDARQVLIGVITDRDIACRAVAEGCDPNSTCVEEVMSTPVVSCAPETSIEDCCRAMEENQIRRVPVVDDAGVCCGIVAQADVARFAPERKTAEVVRDVSKPTDRQSMVGCS